MKSPDSGFPSDLSLDVQEASSAISGPILAPKGGRLISHHVGRGSPDGGLGRVNLDICDFSVPGGVVRVAAAREPWDEDEIELRFEVSEDAEPVGMPVRLESVELNGLPAAVRLVFKSTASLVYQLAVNTVPVYYLCVWGENMADGLRLESAKGYLPYDG